MNMATKHEVMQDNLQRWLACEGNREKRGELIKELSQSFLFTRSPLADQ